MIWGYHYLWKQPCIKSQTPSIGLDEALQPLSQDIVELLRGYTTLPQRFMEFLMGPNMGPNPKDPNWKKQRQSSKSLFLLKIKRSLKKIQQHFARWIRGETLEFGILQAFGCFMIPRSENTFLLFESLLLQFPNGRTCYSFWLNTSPSSRGHGTGRAPPMVTTACPVGHLLGEAMQKWGIQGKLWRCWLRDKGMASLNGSVNNVFNWWSWDLSVSCMEPPNLLAHERHDFPCPLCKERFSLMRTVGIQFSLRENEKLHILLSQNCFSSFLTKLSINFIDFANQANTLTNCWSGHLSHLGPGQTSKISVLPKQKITESIQPFGCFLIPRFLPLFAGRPLPRKFETVHFFHTFWGRSFQFFLGHLWKKPWKSRKSLSPLGGKKRKGSPKFMTVFLLIWWFQKC